MASLAIFLGDRAALERSTSSGWPDIVTEVCFPERTRYYRLNTSTGRVTFKYNDVGHIHLHEAEAKGCLDWAASHGAPSPFVNCLRINIDRYFSHVFSLITSTPCG